MAFISFPLQTNTEIPHLHLEAMITEIQEIPYALSFNQSHIYPAIPEYGALYDLLS
jgi:hypothetical protein